MPADDIEQLGIHLVKWRVVVPRLILGRTFALDGIRTVYSFEMQNMPGRWKPAIIWQQAAQAGPRQPVDLLVRADHPAGQRTQGCTRIHTRYTLSARTRWRNILLWFILIIAAPLPLQRWRAVG